MESYFGPDDWDAEEDLIENDDNNALGLASSSSIAYSLKQDFIYIQGIRISPFDCPECLNVIDESTSNNDIDCLECNFFSPETCKLKNNPFFIEELRKFFAIQIALTIKQNNKLEEIDEIISLAYHELKVHGRPLHYTILAKIIVDRYPDIESSDKRLVLIMARNPNKFEKLDRGLYRAL